MPWVRFDDQYPINRKIKGLSDAAFRLDTEGICWSSRNGTDGLIRRVDLDFVSTSPRLSRQWRSNLARAAAELVHQNRWHEPGHSCESCVQPIDGWVVHDYLKFQPSKVDVLREQGAKAERQRRWMDKRKGAGDVSRHTVRDASEDASQPTGTIGYGAPGNRSDLGKRKVAGKSTESRGKVAGKSRESRDSNSGSDQAEHGRRDASKDAAPSRPAPKGSGEGPPRASDARRQAADAAAAGRNQKPKTVAAHSPPNGATPNTDEHGMPPSLESRAADPPNLTQLRKQLADNARQHRAAGNRRPGAFDELLAATDDNNSESGTHTNNSEEGQS
jgi:hypothetical protein